MNTLAFLSRDSAYDLQRQRNSIQRKEENMGFSDTCTSHLSKLKKINRLTDQNQMKFIPKSSTQEIVVMKATIFYSPA